MENGMSYIICFARIADESRANKIVNENYLNVYSAKQIKGQVGVYGEIGEIGCNAAIYDVDKYVDEYPDANYILIEDSSEAYYGYNDTVEYNHDFEMDEIIGQITEENGFADIRIVIGDGYAEEDDLIY